MTRSIPGRYLYIAAGLVCVALGVLGVILPGMPAAVFLLAASYLFARSSPRLHRMLAEHPVLGGYLRMVQERRMPLRAKVITLVLMWAGIAWSCRLTLDVGLWLPTLIVVLGLIGSSVVLFWIRPARAETVKR